MRTLTIPPEIFQVTKMSEQELLQEIAIMLFEKEKLTLAQASRFAGIGNLQFQHLLGSRQIPVHYDTSEFEEDLQTLRSLDRL